MKLGLPVSTVVTGFALTSTSYNAQLYPDYYYHLYFGSSADVSNTNYVVASYSASNQNPSRL